jgi:hypothetical protein
VPPKKPTETTSEAVEQLDVAFKNLSTKTTFKHEIKYLMVGEANFSFAKALTSKHPEITGKLVATEYRDEAAARAEYGDKYTSHSKLLAERKVKQQMSVDAMHLEAHFPDTRIKRIYFNGPNDGTHWKESPKGVKNLLKNFFQSAEKVQSEGDKVYLGLPKPDPRPSNYPGGAPLNMDTYYQAFRYYLYDASVAAGYRLVAKHHLSDTDRYPEYKHVTTNNSHFEHDAADTFRQYVFIKTDQTETQLRESYKPKYRKKGSDHLAHWPLLATDNESSAYEDTDDEADEVDKAAEPPLAKITVPASQHSPARPVTGGLTRASRQVLTAPK